MSLRIIKEGLLDTVQDTGRCGLQHLGIHRGGAMDAFSAQLANALLGKELKAPVLELHFPAAQILFEKPAIIALTGASFTPLVNNKPVPMHHPIALAENSLLQFARLQEGARVYVSVFNGLKIEKWEGSYSTDIKAGAGGWNGGALHRYDVIPFELEFNTSAILGEKEELVLPWKSQEAVENRQLIECIIGSEWHSLTAASRQTFLSHWFQVGRESDRTGFHLTGAELRMEGDEIMASSAVSFGTVQLLPNGSPVVLMADHQTTGGYPRIAHVITAHLPLLAQKNPGDAFQFALTDLATAEQKWIKQQRYLQEIAVASQYQIENLPHAS